MNIQSIIPGIILIRTKLIKTVIIVFGIEENRFPLIHAIGPTVDFGAGSAAVGLNSIGSLLNVFDMINAPLIQRCH